MHIVATVALYALWAFFGLLWVRFIADWVMVFARSWRPSGGVAVLLEVGHQQRPERAPPVVLDEGVRAPHGLGPARVLIQRGGDREREQHVGPDDPDDAQQDGDAKRSQNRQRQEHEMRSRNLPARQRADK